MTRQKIILFTLFFISQCASAKELTIVFPQEPDKAVNDNVFCVGYGPWTATTDYIKLKPTSVRWGGNTSTRFNFINGNIWNAGKDYYYANVTAGKNNTWKDWIELNNRNNIRSMFTVPGMGFIAKDSFTRGKIGSKPELTSIQYTDAELINWITQLKKELGNIKRIYPIDNEPFLWHSTHADIFPKPISPEEFAEKWLKVARLIRTADKDAILTGPGLWGYKDLENLPAFLDKVIDKTDEKGKVLLDIVNASLYPQNNYLLKSLEDITGLSENQNTEPADKAKLRFESTNAFDTKTYKDQSWINKPVNYINNLNEIITKIAKKHSLSITKYPKIGISEYNWGAPYSKSGAAALANLLFKFLKADIDHACYFTWPPPDSEAGFVFAAIKSTLVTRSSSTKIVVPKDSSVPELYFTQDNKKYLMLTNAEKLSIKNPEKIKNCEVLSILGAWKKSCKLNSLDPYELYKLELNQ